MMTLSVVPFIACTRAHLLKFKTGKVLGDEED